MNSIDDFAGHWLAWIGSSSWQLAVLIVVVGLITAVAQRVGLSARFRHALWLLVLLKVFLPPGLASPVSIGSWVVGPVVHRTQAWRASDELQRDSSQSLTAANDLEIAAVEAADDTRTPGIGTTIELLVSQLHSWRMALMAAWAVGCLLFWIVVARRYMRLQKLLAPANPIEEGPIRIAFEKIAMQLKLHSVPELVAAEMIGSPFLFGVLRPKVVVPQRLVDELTESELRSVLAHELVHWQRGDTWIGWVQVIAQSILWFHPFIWWANSQLRHERECACDEAVLLERQASPADYGESLIRVLTRVQGRSLVAGSLVGIFERGAKLQERLENIMNCELVRKRFDWSSRAALSVLAILLLPMAPPASQNQAEGAPDAKRGVGGEQVAPQIVSTVPKIGSIDVSPDLKAISVTFDRDMGNGMSWTGGPPLFPPIDNSRKPGWTDARTCALPVKLEKGTFYRLGINSSTHLNFSSREGVPAEPVTIFFTTEGASQDVQKQAEAPTIVKLDPVNGAMDVDPNTKELRVTFNMPMGSGMSWVGGGPQFPKIPQGGKGSWSADELTCTLPVTLEPGHDYELGLNSSRFTNFQSKAGVPLKPVVYKFRTRAAKQ
jgi:beta-lactamase regulating signal transducer with metallopeptidase domain